MRTLITLLTISSGLLWLNAGALAQKRDSKVDKAAQRSSLAAEVLTSTINLPDNTIPKELLEKAKAIGVFPDFERISIVMPKSRLSYGVVSRRLENGWTTPAYYGFGFRELETLKARGSKKPDMIVLFMTGRCIDVLLKGRVPLSCVGEHAERC